MIKTVKLGEIKTKIIDEVKKTDELKVLLRMGWGLEITGRLAFSPSEDLKIGDEIKVIIEKVYKEPEPEAEEEAVAGEEVTEALEAEGEGEVPTEEITEDLKAEGEKKVTAEEVTEPLKAEGEEEATADEIAEPLKTEGGEEETAEKI
jgi:hypothetical protein